MSIRERQNTRDAIDVLRAATELHRQAKATSRIRMTVTVAAVGTAVVAGVAGVAPAAAGIVGAVVAVVVGGLWLAERRSGPEAVGAQELFDSTVFGLEPNPRFGLPGPARVKELSAAYAGDEALLRDWYPDTLGAPRPFDALICQRANLAYDAPLRRTWAKLLGVALAGAAGAAVVAGIAGSAVPVLAIAGVPLVLVAVEAVWNWQVAAGKDRLAELVTVRIPHEWRPELGDEVPVFVTDPVTDTTLRDVQDAISELRRRSLRVPDAVYAARRDSSEVTMGRAASALAARLIAALRRPH